MAIDDTIADRKTIIVNAVARAALCFTSEPKVSRSRMAPPSRVASANLRSSEAREQCFEIQHSSQPAMSK
jgi:hypothetical protein